MFKTVSLLAVGISLALPGVAGAHGRHHRHVRTHHVARSNPIQAAFAIATHYWGTVPCSGHITIRVEPTPASSASWERHEDPRFVSMWAGWDTGTPNENNEQAPQPFSNCTIGIDSLMWTSAYEEGYERWPEFAICMVHEFGHLLGLGDLFGPQDSGNVEYVEPSADAALTGEAAPGWG